MKIIKLLSLTFMLVSLFILASCTNTSPKTDESTPTDGEIFLYGELHGLKEYLTKELELWSDYYHNKGMRHLFVEDPYFTAEFLNIWMKSDNDDILNAVHEDYVGTPAYVPVVKDFYKQIKSEFPETVFHGTDIGHQFNTTGERYLSYLKENNMEDSDEYAMACESIAQGKHFYEDGKKDFVYREDRMVENFIREFDKLNGESVMGIYGSAHVYLDGLTYTSDDHPCMGNQLSVHYGEKVHAEDIMQMMMIFEPLRVETIMVNGKEYEASYYGERDISYISLSYVKRAFWRLENAYSDFADYSRTGDALSYYDYPMPIEKEQIFVIDYIRRNGSVTRKYYRSGRNDWDEYKTTEQFNIE